MKKTVIEYEEKPKKFLISRQQNELDSKFPYSFSGGYSIIEHDGSETPPTDTYDDFNNCEFYQKITENSTPVGLNRNNFPELKVSGNESYLTNTGIVVIFTGTHAIIYDILDNGILDTDGSFEEDNYDTIITSSINNFFITNENNPANHRYIAVSVNNGEVLPKKECLYKMSKKEMIDNEEKDIIYQYYTIDMDLEGINVNSDGIFYEPSSTFSETFEYFSFKKRQMFIFQSNLSNLNFYYYGSDKTIKLEQKIFSINTNESLQHNIEGKSTEYIYQYILNVEDSLQNNSGYTKISIKTTDTKTSGWVEVF